MKLFCVSFFLLLMLSFVAGIDPVQTFDGKTIGKFGGIIGGSEASVPLPWFARMLIVGDNSYVCGATLVQQDIVLTAAHCVDIPGFSSITLVHNALNVDFGTVDMDGNFVTDGTQLEAIPSSLKIHEGWDDSNVGAGNDLAMFKISSPVSSTSIVRLNFQFGVPSNGQTLHAYGHGKTTDGGSGSDALKTIETNAVLPCSGGLASQHVCVFASSTTGACQGDSGGPVVTSSDPNEAIQIGVASYVIGDGVGVCATGSNDVYMSVFKFKSWIEDYICENSDYGCLPATSTLAATLSGLCFSSHATATVEGKGVVRMKDVVVGDRVLTAGGQYQTVFTLTHYDSTEETIFYQIETTLHNGDGSSALELSPLHMIFLEGKMNPIPAQNVKVGDFLQTLDGGERVTNIRLVSRRGIYNPITADGTVIVDKVFVASTYTSFTGTSNVDIVGYKFMSIQGLMNTLFAPYGAFCMSTSFFDLCNRHKEGELSTLHKAVHSFRRFLLDQNDFAQFLIFTIFLCCVGVANLITNLYCGICIIFAFTAQLCIKNRSAFMRVHHEGEKKACKNM